MTTHIVPADVFDALAHGSGDMRGVLHAGQRSKRLLLLYEVVITARERVPQLFAEAGSAEVFADLVGLHRVARQAVDGVLLHPTVGAWATDCLRSLLVDREAAPSQIGHLGAIAAAAALRSDLPFDLTTYVRDGSVMLPTYGLVWLEAQDGWCQLRSGSSGDRGARAVEIEAGGVTQVVGVDTINHPFDSSRWQPIRRLRSTCAGAVIDIQLDDVDPFRDCDQLSITPRLDDAAVDDWQTKLDDAWALLVHDHPFTAEAISAGVQCVIPLFPTTAATELSATCHEAIGAVAMTHPRRSLTMALALVHEFQHTKLSALLDLVPLVDGSRQAVFYAPWRSDPRPLRGLLQGTYAFLGLAGFWGVHRHHSDPDQVTAADWAHFEFALCRDQVEQALVTLQTCGQLRSEGMRFVAGMRDRVRELLAEDVPSMPRSLAAVACRDHATAWRLRNIQPDTATVVACADAWLVHPAPHLVHESDMTCGTLIDGGGLIPSHERLVLLRNRLAFPTEWRTDAGTATEADIVFVGGKVEWAAQEYKRQIEKNPDDLASWAGLALALGERSTPAARVLAGRPELVHAVHRVVRDRIGTAPDPEDLASWLAPATSAHQ